MCALGNCNIQQEDHVHKDLPLFPLYHLDMLSKAKAYMLRLRFKAIIPDGCNHHIPVPRSYSKFDSIL